MFQRVPGQIHAVNVPGTQWSEENGNDGGLFHIEEADAPSTDCGEKATKRSDESRSLLAARADARAHHGPCATDLRANISSSSKRRRLLGLDTRLSQADRDFLLRFFESLGLAEVADLQDVGAFQPLPHYLRTSLEAYQKQQGLRGREKRSHAGHFGPPAEAAGRGGAKQGYRQRK